MRQSRLSPPNRHKRFTRLGAALALAAFGAPLFLLMPPLGILLMSLGLIGVVYQAVQMWRERPDRYDLSRIWDEPEPEAPEEDNREPGLLWCRRCAVSVPPEFAVCPECGNFLRS